MCSKPSRIWRDTEPVSVVKMTVNHRVVKKLSLYQVTETIEWFPNKKVFSSFSTERPNGNIRHDFAKTISVE